MRDTEVVVVAALRLLSFPLTAATDQSPPPLLSCGRHWASFKIDGGKATHNRPPPKQHQHSLFSFLCVSSFLLPLSPPPPSFSFSSSSSLLALKHTWKRRRRRIRKRQKITLFRSGKEGRTGGLFAQIDTLSVAAKSTFRGCFFLESTSSGQLSLPRIVGQSRNWLIILPATHKGNSSAPLNFASFGPFAVSSPTFLRTPSNEKPRKLPFHE